MTIDEIEAAIWAATEGPYQCDVGPDGHVNGAICAVIDGYPRQVAMACADAATHDGSGRALIEFMESGGTVSTLPLLPGPEKFVNEAALQMRANARLLGMAPQALEFLIQRVRELEERVEHLVERLDTHNEESWIAQTRPSHEDEES